MPLPDVTVLTAPPLSSRREPLWRYTVHEPPHTSRSFVTVPPSSTRAPLMTSTTRSCELEAQPPVRLPLRSDELSQIVSVAPPHTRMRCAAMPPSAEQPQLPRTRRLWPFRSIAVSLPTCRQDGVSVSVISQVNRTLSPASKAVFSWSKEPTSVNPPQPPAMPGMVVQTAAMQNTKDRITSFFPTTKPPVSHFLSALISQYMLFDIAIICKYSIINIA